ncbi:GNAT family N-acetyltransferase [Bacillaceae bacterium SIJ1]|uniref:GNAT family N-acetyltransferase n=1 Tax=Litoribacterium kuwaitense TaxID=1398745 RepID=UPI0013ED6F13|nr:GNAT family protein [Litoribacterium kuwaitense]NGP45748.1 GNAT family N-acetyltransferase [Litoribacterium kuwaitense]
MITGKRVELRPVSLADFKRTYKWRNDEEVAVMSAGEDFFRYSHVSEEQLEDAFEKVIKMLDRRESCQFSIYTKDEPALHIGSIGYRDLNPVSRCCTLGISIGERAYWSKGYGSDAVNSLLRYLFQSMNIERVQLDTWSGNTRAIRSYEKCGFTIEGRLRNNAYVNGAYYDTIVMGILRKEYSL